MQPWPTPRLGLSGLSSTLLLLLCFDKSVLRMMWCCVSLCLCPLVRARLSHLQTAASHSVPSCYMCCCAERLTVEALVNQQSSSSARWLAWRRPSACLLAVSSLSLPISHKCSVSALHNHPLTAIISLFFYPPQHKMCPAEKRGLDASAVLELINAGGSDRKGEGRRTERWFGAERLHKQAGYKGCALKPGCHNMFPL